MKPFGLYPKLENTILEKDDGSPIVKLQKTISSIELIKEKRTTFDLKQKLLLLEELGVLNFLETNYSGDLNKSRASKILHPLLGDNTDNIRKALSALESGKYSKSFKYQSDKVKIEEFLKDLG